MSFLSNIFSRSNTKGLKEFEPLVAQVNGLEQATQALSDADLKVKTAAFQARLKEARSNSGESAKTIGATDAEKAILAEIQAEAFALVREASRRTLGQRHFDVQIIGGAALNSGSIAEMRTGEGKTLVATLPAYLNALTGKGVHIVTVNDYLSRRDAVWMGQIYDALGLTVGVINHESSFIYDPAHKAAPVPATNADDADGDKKIDELDKKRDETGSFHVVHEFLRPCTRHEAYMADITYGTNNEFGFDYLRDNLEYSSKNLRQRDPNYAIVDEIDSILIDEARTPLIISAPTRDAEAIYKQFASMTASFIEDVDYLKDEKRKAITLTDAGISKAEKALGVENIYTDKGIKFVHHLETAIRAKALYHKDKEYVVKNNEIVIVDEFTGRMQPGRRWSEGLHQAIEAKEGVSIQQESRTYASITFQNFFRMYPKISGMTGTAATSGEEFFKVYGLEVAIVPTNKPTIRDDRNDQIFKTEIGKFKAIAREVRKVHDAGQPVLIGTVSIEKNEILSQFLKAEGIPHEVLNAKNHEREGEIIAQAGRKGAVTIATNMAGRGVDIKLGGVPSTPETADEIKKLGGLFVLGTERHEARRIDNQLRGRSGRQGDPGVTQFFVSLEDTLMRVFASDMLKGLMNKLGVAEDVPIEHKMISNALESAQEKIEGFNFDSRKHVLEFDDIINTQRGSVYARRRKLLLGSVDDVEAELEEIVAGDVGSIELISKKIAEFGREAFLNAARIVLLQATDMYWVEHLEVMDHTRSSVNLRAYGQRDPLVEYKKEGLRLFKEMQNAMRDQVIRLLPHIVPVNNGAAVSAKDSEAADLKEVHENAQLIGGGDGSAGSTNSTGGVGSAAGKKSGEPEIGRNDPCSCGSGKKYKKCHGQNK